MPVLQADCLPRNEQAVQQPDRMDIVVADTRVHHVGVAAQRPPNGLATKSRFTQSECATNTGPHPKLI